MVSLELSAFFHIDIAEVYSAEYTNIDQFAQMKLIPYISPVEINSLKAPSIMEK